MTEQIREGKAPLRARLLMAFRASAYAIKRLLKQLGVAAFSAVQLFASRWISADNMGLLAGVWLLTKGASHWGEYVGHLTCGTLILSLTILHLVSGRAR